MYWNDKTSWLTFALSFIVWRVIQKISSYLNLLFLSVIVFLFLLLSTSTKETASITIIAFIMATVEFMYFSHLLNCV